MDLDIDLSPKARLTNLKEDKLLLDIEAAKLNLSHKKAIQEEELRSRNALNKAKEQSRITRYEAWNNFIRSITNQDGVLVPAVVIGYILAACLACVFITYFGISANKVVSNFTCEEHYEYVDMTKYLNQETNRSSVFSKCEYPGKMSLVEERNIWGNLILKKTCSCD